METNNENFLSNIHSSDERSTLSMYFNFDIHMV